MMASYAVARISKPGPVSSPSSHRSVASAKATASDQFPFSIRTPGKLAEKRLEG